MKLKDKSKEQIMAELMKNPVFKTVFSSWINMLLAWKPAQLHGLATISAIESAVVYCVLEAVQSMNPDSQFHLFIDAARPIDFSYMAADGNVVYKTITVKQTPNLIS